MLEHLDRLVSAESPSTDVRATAACADVLSILSQEVLGTAPERVELDGRVHLRWGTGRSRLLLLGHLDTVWPVGTIKRRPFSVSDDQARGPGVFDMKAGIVQGLYALAELNHLDGIHMLVTSDEEIGSPTSRPLIEEAASGVQAVLVLEPSEDGALKIARKGVSMYRLAIEGRAAHAGLEPDKGANALVELAHLVHKMQDLVDSKLGTTVTPTLASAGTASNVVPAQAELHVDVRALTVEEQDRVDRALRSIEPSVPGTVVAVDGGPNRPPLQATMSADLFQRAIRVAADLGLPPPSGVSVGGASDGNFTAGVGTPTLDGLGAVGAGAHAEDEHIVVSSMPDRATLLAALIEDLL